MGAALKFKNADIPRQATEKARLKVVAGPEIGAVFVIGETRATIGRGEDCDVVLTDLKASRKHAELMLVGNQWSIRDLGSSNGIQHNGMATRSASLKMNDVFTMGETTLEFVSAEAGTAILRSVPRTLEQIKADQSAFNVQRGKVHQLAQIGPPTRSVQAPAGVSKDLQRKPVLLAVAAAIAAFVLLTSSDKPLPRPVKDKKDLAQFLPSTPDPSVSKSAEMFLRSGFREYREKNFLRARMQFETVLQIDPANTLGTRYLQNCNEAINEEVKFDLDRGREAYEAGNLTQSRFHYESVLRLLYRDQSNPSYIEARDQLAVVMKEMKEN